MKSLNDIIWNETEDEVTNIQENIELSTLGLPSNLMMCCNASCSTGTPCATGSLGCR